MEGLSSRPSHPIPLDGWIGDPWVAAVVAYERLAAVVAYQRSWHAPSHHRRHRLIAVKLILKRTLQASQGHARPPRVQRTVLGRRQSSKALMLGRRQSSRALVGWLSRRQPVSQRGSSRAPALGSYTQQYQLKPNRSLHRPLPYTVNRFSRILKLIR